ncbi:MAG: hypothetical protein LH616_19360 [Ilumatobacteraceae bacterium]|nr:hypothetical protein [Ilumatobacteraceae bacterium]
MALRTRRVFVVATVLLLSACQPDRVISGWLAQPTNQPTNPATTARPEALTAPAHFVSGWVPYWGTAPSRAAIINRSGSIGDVTPLFYGANNDGTLRLLGPQSQLDATITAARSAGLPLFAGVFDSTGKGIMSGILDDPVARSAHIVQLVKLAVTKGFDGIDLDYEVFAFSHPRSEWAAITVDWVAFVNQLSNALHANGKLLSVTVPPVYVDSAGVTRGYTVYAQDMIANAVDRLRLMVYDWSTSSPGPIAPMDWVNRVIAYSSSVVPVSKLQLGVPAYGRHWTTKKNASETCPDAAVSTVSVLMKNIATVTAGRAGVRDSSGELKYTWTQVVSGPRTKPLTPPVIPPSSIVIAEINAASAGGTLQPALRLSSISPLVTCTVQHTVFVPDEYSVDQRSDAAQAAGWRGIIVWAFGYETDNMYTVLAS